MKVLGFGLNNSFTRCKRWFGASPPLAYSFPRFNLCDASQSIIFLAFLLFPFLTFFDPPPIPLIFVQNRAGVPKSRRTPGTQIDTRFFARLHQVNFALWQEISTLVYFLCLSVFCLTRAGTSSAFQSRDEARCGVAGYTSLAHESI